MFFIVIALLILAPIFVFGYIRGERQTRRSNRWADPKWAQMLLDPDVDLAKLPAPLTQREMDDQIEQLRPRPFPVPSGWQIAGTAAGAWAIHRQLERRHRRQDRPCSCRGEHN